MMMMMRVSLALLFGGAMLLAFTYMASADDEYGCSDEIHDECAKLDEEFQCVYSKLKNALTFSTFRTVNF